ncbi:MAG: cysteine-rich KTR domain-containing protein [Planctomycetia bacterium]|nr:cysteine-rich KTR domain-containing protein [Planctomycetia bacterium]
MPIPVLCPGCKSRFAVSDQFAGRTGPCPKCKQPIKIPALAVKAVTIHEPEAPVASSTATGRAPTAPIRRIERPIPPLAFVATAGAAVALAAVAFVTGRVFQPESPPSWLLLSAAFLVAIPCVMLGYVAVRDRELEAYRGRSFFLRSLICAAVYAGLWAVKGLLPAEATAEMWQWVYLGPMFVVAGAIAALATFDLDWGTAVAHFSCYAMFTAFLRWLLGLPPL